MTRFADTSFWFGLHTRADARHQSPASLWRTATDRIITTNVDLGDEARALGGEPTTSAPVHS